MSERDWQWAKGRVVPGFGVASGRAEDSPYEDGSVILQRPYFKEMGVDIGLYFPGTINVSLKPLSFELVRADTVLRQVNWHASIEPEDFSFLELRIKHDDNEYHGSLYYPHPETKLQHHQGNSVIEVLAPAIDGLTYGDAIEIAYPKGAMLVS